MTARRIRRLVTAQPASDGAGVRLNRSLGSAQLPDLDPFLLLDEFRSDDPNDYIAGFPEHPHRGFETVTYMLAGHMHHRDNQGNSGHLRPGSVQWMTAGRGLVHSEMPKQENGLMWGFQLWVNLPAAQKLRDPRYQDIPPEQIPQWTSDAGVTIRLLAGSLQGREGPVRDVAVEPLYAELQMPSGSGPFTVPVPAEHNGFVYVFEGSGRVGDAQLNTRQLGVLGPGDTLTLSPDTGGMRCLLAAGLPLKEPVARFGPFVMNRVEEIQQAVLDFESGRF